MLIWDGSGLSKKASSKVCNEFTHVSEISNSPSVHLHANLVMMLHYHHIVTMMILASNLFLHIYVFRSWQVCAPSGTTSPPWPIFSVHPISKPRHNCIEASAPVLWKCLYSAWSLAGCSFRICGRYNWKCPHPSLGGTNAPKLFVMCWPHEETTCCQLSTDVKTGFSSTPGTLNRTKWHIILCLVEEEVTLITELGQH